MNRLFTKSGAKNWRRPREDFFKLLMEVQQNLAISAVGHTSTDTAIEPIMAPVMSASSELVT